MAIKPILFGTPMVQAILDNRKSQTRRTNGLEIPNQIPNEYKFLGFDKDIAVFKSPEGKFRNCKPKYIKGDILWVRETFIEWNGVYQYKPLPFGEELGKWKPSIHMPKEAARIFLEVTDFSCERIQDITEDDAIAEGVERISIAPFVHRFKNYLNNVQLTGPKQSFKTLWIAINGKDSWNQNPFVWVYEFKRVEKPSNF